MDLLAVLNLATEKMVEQGLGDWHFKLDNSPRRFGCCKYRTRTISISTKLALLNSEKEVLNTILHEIAHALVGSHNAHNYIWRQKAIEIGCNGNRCCDTTKVIAPPKKYIGTCPSCKGTIQRHRRKDIACAKCCRQFAFTWREHNSL